MAETFARDPDEAPPIRDADRAARATRAPRAGPMSVATEAGREGARAGATSEAPMRILQMCTTFGPGGIQRHAIDLGMWLRARGHHVAFAGAPRGWFDSEEDPDYLALDVDKVSWEGGHAITRVWHLLACAAKLRPFLKRHRFDLIHAHESAPALVARLAALGLDVPIAVTYHGSEPERVPQFGRVANRTARLVITPSHRTAADLRTRGGVEPGKLRVIGLGVAERPEADAASVARLREELAAGGATRIVLVVARLSPQKGIDVLIDVVARVAAVRPDIRFVVVGEGPQEDEVPGWAAQAGVSDHIAFVGPKRNVYDYLLASDLFLLTSRWEALPISIVEAFRAGVPVVTTDCGGCAELVDDSVGRVLPIGDVDAIAASVLAICGDDEARAAMAAAAFRRSREDRFTPDHIHGLFEKTYRALCDRLDGAPQRAPAET